MNSGTSFQHLASHLRHVQDRLRDAEAGKVTRVGDVLYDAEVEITNRIQRHLRDMPMKMSPVSVFYCLRTDIKAILARARESEARATSTAAGKQDKRSTGIASHPDSGDKDTADSPQQKQDSKNQNALKHEGGYGSFNAWRKAQSQHPKDEAFEIFMKLYRTQRSSLS